MTLFPRMATELGILEGERQYFVSPATAHQLPLNVNAMHKFLHLLPSMLHRAVVVPLSQYKTLCDAMESAGLGAGLANEELGLSPNTSAMLIGTPASFDAGSPPVAMPGTGAGPGSTRAFPRRSSLVLTHDQSSEEQTLARHRRASLARGSGSGTLTSVISALDSPDNTGSSGNPTPRHRGRVETGRSTDDMSVTAVLTMLQAQHSSGAAELSHAFQHTAYLQVPTTSLVAVTGQDCPSPLIRDLAACIQPLLAADKQLELQPEEYIARVRRINAACASITAAHRALLAAQHHTLAMVLLCRARAGSAPQALLWVHRALMQTSEAMDPASSPDVPPTQQHGSAQSQRQWTNSNRGGGGSAELASSASLGYESSNRQARFARMAR